MSTKCAFLCCYGRRYYVARIRELAYCGAKATKAKAADLGAGTNPVQRHQEQLAQTAAAAANMTNGTGAGGVSGGTT